MLITLGIPSRTFPLPPSDGVIGPGGSQFEKASPYMNKLFESQYAHYCRRYRTTALDVIGPFLPRISPFGTAYTTGEHYTHLRPVMQIPHYDAYIVTQHMDHVYARHASTAHHYATMWRVSLPPRPADAADDVPHFATPVVALSPAA
jgi:hypothetical protein